jgi:hypothetical protein
MKIGGQRFWRVADLEGFIAAGTTGGGDHAD